MFTDRKHSIIDNKIRRILIAEDEFINRELLSNILKNDFEIITADNKAEAESLMLVAVDFIPKPYPEAHIIIARVLRTIELFEDRELISAPERDCSCKCRGYGHFTHLSAHGDVFYVLIGDITEKHNLQAESHRRSTVYDGMIDQFNALADALHAAEQANHAKQLGKFSVLCYKPYTNCILQTKNRRTFYEQENSGAGSEPCYVLRYSNNRLQRFRLELQEL